MKRLLKQKIKMWQIHEKFEKWDWEQTWLSVNAQIWCEKILQLNPFSIMCAKKLNFGFWKAAVQLFSL